MATVITNEKIGNHSINKYNFKVLSSGENSDEFIEETSSNLIEEHTPEENPNRRSSDVDSSAISQSSKDALIESLMQKTDEMSSNFIKLQMKLEAKEDEYKVKLQKVKEEAFSEGIEEGRKKVAQEEKVNIANGLAQFSSSVSTLDKSAKDFDSALEVIKGELIVAALDISKEVIEKELSQNSQEVAKALGDKLIEELQGASKITLRINPKDYTEISKQVDLLSHVEVISDNAVSEGGVVAISDVGNIDSQISKRFEKVKRAALSE